jgi:flagellar hook-length control protein FliK
VAPAEVPPPPPSVRAPPPPLPARQVAPIAVALAAGGEVGSRFTFSLRPAELGRVDVAIEREGAEASIRITAERPETLLLLLRDRAELQRALDGAGFGDGSTALAFDLAGQAGSGGSGQGSHQEGGAQPGHDPRQAARHGVRHALPADAPAFAQPARAAPRGLLDLAV